MDCPSQYPIFDILAVMRIRNNRYRRTILYTHRSISKRFCFVFVFFILSYKITPQLVCEKAFRLDKSQCPRGRVIWLIWHKKSLAAVGTRMENHVFIIILFFPKYTQPRSTDGKRTERGDSVLVFFFLTIRTIFVVVHYIIIRTRIIYHRNRITVLKVLLKNIKRRLSRTDSAVSRRWLTAGG